MFSKVLLNMLDMGILLYSEELSCSPEITIITFCFSALKKNWFNNYLTSG